MTDGMDKKSSHGQWQQIEEDIAEDILTGRLSPKAQLPKEADLMERFGVGRHTIRRAIWGSVGISAILPAKRFLV